MKYLIYRAFQKLWINKKIYFAIALELAIGITVVLCGISSAYSAKDRLKLYKQQIGEQGIVIEYSGNSGFAGTELPISVEDYETIKEEHSELDISYLLFTRSIYQTRKSFDVKGVTFVSMDTESFFNCFGFAPQENAIYLGTQAADDLEKEGLSFFEKWLSWDESNVMVGDLDIEDIVRLDTANKSIFVTRLVDLKVESMIILPEKCMDLLELNVEEQLTPCLRIVTDSNGGVQDAVSEIVQTLQGGHPAYSYRISEQYLELQKSITDLTQEIRLFSWIAWFVLIITMVGIIGILLIYMEKRKREFAVILALGGTHATVFKEIFLEVFLLCFISGCIALMTAIIIVPYLSTSVFTAYFHWINVVVMLGIVFTITIISCICMIVGIRDVYPAKILKK
ncbi:MAG: ABC transporter permease [Lachnospiraceae bacterium]|nr:ABC transporter permease [Lachnospiraceae bacterium]